MKKIYKVFITLFSFATVLICSVFTIYASGTDYKRSVMESNSVEISENAYENDGAATTSGETAESTEGTVEEISDGQMILVMLGGMVFIAAIIVLFAGINYRKTNLNEKSGKRDVF